MRQRRATDTIITDRTVKRELISNCSHPEIMERIIQAADSLAFTPKAARADAVRLLMAFCNAQPCILWTPHHQEHSRHLAVRIQFGGESVISISRIMWAVFHVVPEQGDHLRAEEDIVHSCEHNGQHNTGWNACLNPAHLVKLDQQSRMKVTQARKLMRQVGLMRVAS